MWSCLFIIVWESYRSILNPYLSGSQRLLYPFFFSSLFYFIHCIWHGLAFFLVYFLKTFRTGLLYGRYFHYVSIDIWCTRSDEQCFPVNFGVVGYYKNLYMFGYANYTSTNQYGRTTDFDLCIIPKVDKKSTQCHRSMYCRVTTSGDIIPDTYTTKAYHMVYT